MKSVFNFGMKKAFEEVIVDSLNDYRKATGMKQKEIAVLLGWSPQDLNDIIKRRKAVGAYRMRHMMEALGEIFSHNLLQRLSFRKESTAAAVEPTISYLYKNEMEKSYIEKLVAILRGHDEQAVLAVKASIDMAYRLRKGKQKIF